MKMAENNRVSKAQDRVLSETGFGFIQAGVCQPWDRAGAVYRPFHLDWGVQN